LIVPDFHVELYAHSVNGISRIVDNSIKFPVFLKLNSSGSLLSFHWHTAPSKESSQLSFYFLIHGASKAGIDSFLGPINSLPLLSLMEARCPPFKVLEMRYGVLKGTLLMVKGVLVNYGSIDYKLDDCLAASGSRLLLLLSRNNGSNGSVVVSVGCDMPAEQD
jgi:hypothetical protein